MTPQVSGKVAHLHHALDQARELLTAHIERTIRELQAALVRVTTDQGPLASQLAEIALRDLIPEGPQPEIDVPTVMAVTAEYFDLTIGELRGPRKTKQLARARQIAMYLCRELVGLSLPRIGLAFDRHHTTVMHAHRKIRTEIAEHGPTHNQAQKLTALITQRAAMTTLRQPVTTPGKPAPKPPACGSQGRRQRERAGNQPGVERRLGDVRGPGTSSR